MLLDPRFVLTKIFRPKIYWTQILFDLGPKLFKQKFFDLRIDFKMIFGAKIFLAKHFFGQNLLDPKFFGPKSF